MSQRIEVSPILDFYSEKSILITGASGYLGRALVEKLLRTCTNLSTVYVLLRPKNNQDVDQRLATLLQSPIFNILKKLNPEALKKVIALSGDITIANLGLNEIDRQTICESVSVVFHSAASIKFNESVKSALDINYHGTEKVIELCKDIKSLKAVVHVSTAYAHCDRKEIKEHIPKDNLSVFTLDEVESMSTEQVDKLAGRIIGGKPNTYTYAKAETEYLIQKEANSLPICMVRPSMVASAWKEPEPGYVDSAVGMTGCIAAFGKGMLASFICDGNLVGDLIPLDVTVNLIIASAWKTAVNNKTANNNVDNSGNEIEIPVYNCCSGSLNPIKYDRILQYLAEAWEKYPLEGVVRYPDLKYTRSRLVNYILTFWYHFLPYCIMDGLSILVGKKPKMLKLLNKISTIDKISVFVRMSDWRFETKNMPDLAKGMSKLDQELFFMNVEDMDWKTFCEDYCLGIKKWICKEKMSDISKAYRHRRWVHWADNCFRVVLIASGVLILSYWFR